MLIQRRFETSVKKIVHLLKKKDPRIIERRTNLPKIEINLEKELDTLRPHLGVLIEKDKIVIPRVSEDLLEPLLAKIAWDWVILPYMQKLPDLAYQFSFLIPVFVLKSGKWQVPWDQLWAEVFPTPIYHGRYEFSREYLLGTYDYDEDLLLLNFLNCVKSLMEKSESQRLKTIPLEMFLKEFFAQIFSLRGLNETEKKIITGAIDFGSADAQILKAKLHLPRSTAYNIIQRCLRKLDLIEKLYLKYYCLELEPILLFFLGIGEEDAIIIEQHFRATPYCSNSGRLITPEYERTRRDNMTVFIKLYFPGRFTYKLQTQVNRFVKDYGFHAFHWFRYDRFEHGYDLRRFGINIQKHRSFDYRGGIVAKRVILLPGDLSIIGHRQSVRPTPSLRKIEQDTGIKISRSYSAEKRLFPEIIAGNDISIEVKHFLPVDEFRLIMRNPNFTDLQYFKGFPEHYFYFDVNERELLVLLMVPEEQSQEIKDYVTERSDRVILSGFNRGPLYSHLFNLADLEEEYDYEKQEWLDPFRFTEWWEWML
ncbi:MAG: hypothetical protein ACE5R6_19740 [Candidatus Heimdallarchaeota archaeon]